MPLLEIGDREDPRLKVYRSLKGSDQNRRSSRFVVEGEHLVRRLLQSEFSVVSVLTGKRRLERLLPAIPEHVDVFVADSAVVDGIIGYKFHSGVLACGERRPNPGFDSLEPLLVGDRPATVCVCVHVDNPDNLGTILRTCSALGVDWVLLGEGCPDPFSRRALRVSMGEAFRLPVREAEDLDTDLRTLRDRFGFELTATVVSSEAEPLPESRPSRRTAVVFGNEAHGLADRWVGLCDRRVRIPMSSTVDSLNVAVAAGICLYHFTNGRRVE